MKGFFKKRDENKRMTYKEEDWQRALRRLHLARGHYLDYKKQDAEIRLPDLLDEAVHKCWTVGEYAIKCLGQNPPQDHSQPEQARNLFATGKLTQDYSKALEQLEAFRKKSAHLGYTKENSTHYSSADVNRCLTMVEELCAEVEVLLRKKHPSR